MPSSTTLPVQPTPLTGASAPAGDASSFERMQADLKAVQQQALATQKALQQLEARKPVDAYSAVTSQLPGFSALDGAVLGVASALALTGLVVWWYVWHRPHTRWMHASAQRTPRAPTQRAAAPTTPHAVQPSQARVEETESWSASTASGEFSTHGFEPSSPFARQEPNMAFDSAAAASEVMRVRKSLAEKREARAHFLEREDGTDSIRSPDADLDIDLDLDEAPTPPMRAWLDNTDQPVSKPDAALAASAVVESKPEPELDLDLDLGLDPDPWRQPGETTPGTNGAQPDDAIHFSLALDDYGVQPEAKSTPDVQPLYELAMDLSPEAVTEDGPPAQSMPDDGPAQDPALDIELHPSVQGGKTYDYTITMALAQESAALELWAESRDLATEVLASDDAGLVAQAQALLERLTQLEQDAPPDTHWSTVR
nr:hypothetical protein [uncultured Rhodoferax sp.]